MIDTDKTARLIRQQCGSYPRLGAQDVVKALYQAEFGCGHFVTDREKGLKWLIDEEKTLARTQREAAPPFVEPLGDLFCRAHLSGLSESGVSPETLFTLFALSAEQSAGGMEDFLEALTLFEGLAESGEICISGEEARAFLTAYRAAGCPSTHHTDAFRAAYAPAYRVIRAEYARFLPLLGRIDRLLHEKDCVTFAIEGGSASGKSSLGALLARVYDLNLFHMDDFFLQPHQRTPERFQEPGGNVDRERFLSEVLEPLRRGEAFDYRVFDCSQMALGESVHVVPKRLNVVEGAYSMHPALAGAYDLSVFLTIDPAEQARRILVRNGEAMQRRFLNEWIPMEHVYFDSLNVRDRCTLIL